MSIVSVKNLNRNNPPSFWEEYPNFTIKAPFSDLYSSDRTKDKTYSSLVMWAIALTYCSDSIHIEEQPVEKRKEFIAKDFLPERFKFDWYGEITIKKIKVKELEDSFNAVNSTQAERTLESWKKKLLEFQDMLENNPITFDMEIDDMEKMMKVIDKLPKLFEMYDKTRKVVLEETQSRNKGGDEPSLSDSGLI